MQTSVTSQSASKGDLWDYRSVITSVKQSVPLDPATSTLILGVTAVFLFLLFRNIGLHASLFGDEWSYSFFSRLGALSAAPTSNYIYLSLFRSTRACGSGFLECARIINSLLFVSASIFVYWTARQVATKPVAVLVTLLALVGPINIYTVYFMPEAMYFASFWLLTWFIIAFRDSRSVFYGSIIGCLCAAMTMIKPNAIFLLPGIVLFVLYKEIHRAPLQQFKKGIVAIGYLLIAAAVVRLGLGYFFAGHAGLNILGTKYAALSHSALTWERASQMSGLIVGNLAGHIMGIMLLFGMPIASIVAMEFSKSHESEPETTLHLVEVYLISIIIPLLAVTAYFEASVSGTGGVPIEAIARLAMRYYDFTFPLFLIVAAGQLSAKGKKRSAYAVPVAVALVVGICLCSFRFLRRDYTLWNIDCPELHGFTAQTTMFYLLGILGMTSVIAWAVNRKVSSQLFLFVFAPVSVLWSTSVINGELRQLVTPDLYNRAGMFTHEVLSKHDRSKLVVGGEELAGLLNVLFYVDDPDAQTLVIPKGAPFDRSVVQYDREWLLLVGDHSVPSDAEAQIVGDGFALFRIGRRDTRRSPRSMALDVDFSHNAWPGVFNEVSGLSLPEDFGRWSDEAEVKLGLSSPLPRSFDLRLTASAFGPNTDLPFSIRIGPEVRSFRLRDVPTDAYFSFTTDGTEKLITISVPKPISPKQLGISSDDRRLGLALRQLSIVSNDK